MGSGTRRPWGEAEVLVRPATAADITRFAPTLEEEDVAEIRALSGMDPVRAMSLGYAYSDESYSIVIEPGDHIIAMAGATSYADGGTPAATVWLLCGPRAKEQPFTFGRIIRTGLREFSSRYGVLILVADERNRHHIRWLESLGFKTSRALLSYGAERRTFIEMTGVF